VAVGAGPNGTTGTRARPGTRCWLPLLSSSTSAEADGPGSADGPAGTAARLSSVPAQLVGRLIGHEAAEVQALLARLREWEGPMPQGWYGHKRMCNKSSKPKQIKTTTTNNSNDNHKIEYHDIQVVCSQTNTRSCGRVPGE